jgi:hypothetical protein
MAIMWWTMEIKELENAIALGLGRGNPGTSMIGNSQGEAEIPPDLAEGVLPTGKALA